MLDMDTTEEALMRAASNLETRDSAGLARPGKPGGKRRGRFPWPWRQEGRHFKLMLAVSVAVVVAVPFLLARSAFAAAVALVLWLLTLAVQWLCIEPPGVEEKDLH